MSNQTLKIAVVPGSFDPITYGHMDIIQRAAEQYQKVYVAIMINPDKKYMFSLEQRKAIAQAALADVDKVEVLVSEGMLWKLAMDLGACAIVKGYRNQTDWEYEQKMAVFNQQMNPDAPTVLLESKKEFLNISSTAVRQKIERGESLSEFLPPCAEELIARFLGH